MLPESGGGRASTVVLVPGAFHGPWCFDRVTAGLGGCGIRSCAVDLGAAGGGAHPPDLHGDAARVREALDAVDGPVVLVGHSYAGAVITEAGDHPAVAHLVYLSGLVPDRDEFCGGYLFPDGEPPPAGEAPATATVDATTAAWQFYNGCDARTTAWASERLRPQSLAWLGQRPFATAWRTKPSTYVVCTRDRAVDPRRQREWAERCTEFEVWDSGHSPFLSHPERVVELVARLAGATAGSGTPA